MGLGCCKDSPLPVVDDKGKQHREATPPVKLPELPSVQFDYAVPDSSLPSMCNRARGGSLSQSRGGGANLLEMSMYTARDLDATMSGGAGGDASTSTSRNANLANLLGNSSFHGEASGLSFVTNGLTDVSSDYVLQFVRHVVRMSEDPSASIFDQTLSNTQLGATRRVTATSPGNGGSYSPLTAEQQQFINTGPDLQAKLTRLMEAEEVSRQEIFAAWRMNEALLVLAVKGVLPTLRQRRPSLAASSPGKSANGRRESHVDPKELSRARSGPTSSKSLRSTGAGGRVGTDEAPPSTMNCPQGRPVLLIYSKDVDLELTSGATSHRWSNDAALASAGGRGETPGRPPSGSTLSATDAVGRSESPPLYSPVGNEASRDSPPNKLGPDTVVEHYEVMAFTGREISMTATVKAQIVTSSWDFLSEPSAQNLLNAGNVFFRFFCGALDTVSPDALEGMNLCINLTSFRGAEAEHGGPQVDIMAPEEQAKFVSIIVKTMYILPGVKLASITKDLVSSFDYQRACQPGDVKVESTDLPPDTFRIVKTVIKFIFSITVMMKVSEITDPQVLFAFKEFDGMVPAKALMLERTKRNPTKVDSTVKVRSLLLYYPVNDGLLCTNLTFVLNSSLSKMVSKVLDTFGSQGAAEAALTAKLTRQYLIQRYGDAREG